MSTRPTQYHSSKHHRRKWLVLAAGTAIVALLAVFALRNYIWHPTVTIDRERYPVAGIDVSNHNGVIDFQRVAAAGIEFAIVKASEGTSYVDPRFTPTLTVRTSRASRWAPITSTARIATGWRKPSTSCSKWRA